MRIRDTGPGIPKDEIPKVMQAFGQGSLAHQTAEGGTGLGLPIVKNLVELHDGRFDLKSELRKGTEVTAYFPRKRVLETLPPLQPLGQERHRPTARAQQIPVQDVLEPQPAVATPAPARAYAQRSPRPSRLKHPAASRLAGDHAAVR
jgi:two-component system cell cycle sensor histidine kinase PleC